MDIAESRAPSAARAGAEAAVLAVVGIAAAGALVAWEVARPTLPVAFELATAARSPDAPAWMGRLPMAALAIAGSIALYMFLAQAKEKRAGVYAVAVLATAPAWFVHGRTMTGAMVPMACAAGVMAGVGRAVLGRAGGRERAGTGTGTGTRTWERAGGWLGVMVAVVAAVGSVVATRWGMPNRGLVVVVAVPMIAVGGAAVIGGRGRGRAGTGTGTGTGTWESAGVGVLVIGGMIVLAGVGAWGTDGAFADTLLGSRGGAGIKATFEAPVAALAYGLVPWTPLVPFALAQRPRSATHLALMIGAVLSIAAHAALAPRSGSTSVVGVAAIAGAVAMMLRSLEDARRPAVALVASVVAIGWLVAHDVKLAPERVLLAFGATDAAIPAAHAAASSLAIRSAVWLCTALSAATLIVPRTWLPAGRGLAVVAAGVFAGLVLRAHAYPELLSRLSPGVAFDAWAQRHRAGEPLGLLGVDRRGVAFAPGTAVVPQSDAPSAGRWLAAAAHDVPDEPRRFLALGAAELPRVNAEYRAVRARNVPVLAGREGATLLAASALRAGERSENPLDAVVLTAPPEGLRPLGAVLGDRLDAVGWQLVDGKGRALDAVPRGSRSAHVRVFVRVHGNASVAGHCTFLHVDHSPSRFSAEHRELPYPLTLWRDGDTVVDDYDIQLPSHFRAGSYRMYWGVGVLPCEDDRRMPVTSGPSDGKGRISAGILEVR